MGSKRAVVRCKGSFLYDRILLLRDLSNAFVGG